MKVFTPVHGYGRANAVRPGFKPGRYADQMWIGGTWWRSVRSDPDFSFEVRAAAFGDSMVSVGRALQSSERLSSEAGDERQAAGYAADS